MKPLSVEHVALRGRHLIEASAGTGKTHTITNLVLRLVLERGESIDRILVMTFTKAATAELRARIRARLRLALSALEGAPCPEDLSPILARVPPSVARARLARAVSSFDLASVFTIHGFCQRVLAEHAFESGARFGLALQSNVSHVVLDAIRDEYVVALSSAPPWIADHARLHLALNDIRQLVQARLATPDLVLEADAPLPGTGTLEAYLRARKTFADQWPQQRHAWAALLREGLLNARSHPPRRVRAALAEADRVAVSQDAVVDRLERLKLLTRAALDKALRARKILPPLPASPALDELIVAHRIAEEDAGARVTHLRVQLVQRVLDNLSRRKEELAVRSFDDLLVGLRDALRAPGETLSALLRTTYPVALVDEFQDTDDVQYEILSRIYSNEDGALFLIGDPKQAIYGFRGADVRSYLAASRSVGDNRHGLATSYRADPSLVAAQNGLYRGVENPFLEPEIRYVPLAARPNAEDALRLDGEAVPALEIALVERKTEHDLTQINKTDLERSLAERVAGDVQALLSRGMLLQGRALGASDVAILTRTNRAAAEVQLALGKVGIPAVMVGDRSVFESSEAVELFLMMRAMATPHSVAAVRTALIMPALGLDADALEAMESEDAAWELWGGRFRRWNELWESRGFVHAFHAVMREAEVPARLLASREGERKLTNLQHLAELLHQAAVEQHLGVAGLLRHFDDQLDSEPGSATMAPETQQLRLESDAAAVSVTTVHKSKGLEYSVVYLPHAWQGDELKGDRLRFHDDARGGRVVMRITTSSGSARKTDPAFEHAERELLSETMRVGYVGLTRAKHMTVATFGAVKTAGSSALGRLLLSRGEHRGESAAQRLHALDDAALREELRALARECNGTLQVRTLSAAATASTPAKVQAPSPLAARARVRRLGLHHRTSSFTALTRDAETSIAAGMEHDFDAGVEQASDDRRQVEPLPLADFPRGARAGECLHKILEELDFRDLDPGRRSEIVRAGLQRYGFDVDTHLTAVTHAIGDICAAPLSEGSSFSLSELPLTARRAEMEFVFPVGEKGTLLSPRRLGRLLARHAEFPGARAYGDAVARLDFLPLKGALRGFMDLVFEHGGKYYLVDYKSNYLGAAGEDYAPGRIAAEMARHHYYLQYHLYSVALWRHLATRLPDFEHDTHFGGVYYLFLRGMSKQHPGRGVFFDLPSEALMQVLGDCLAGEGGT